MNIKLYPLALLLFFISNSDIIAQAQTTCFTEETEFIEDLNSITKCKIENSEDSKDKKNSKRVRIVVSSKKMRSRKLRTVKSINLSKESKVSQFKKSALLVGQLEVRNKEALINKLPFKRVEEKPLFPACVDLPMGQATACFNLELAKHIQNNLRYPRKALWHRMEGRVLVQFMIDKKGKVIDIQVKGPENGQLLEEEALRVFETLPTFVPGKVNGKPVYVNKGVPINFVLPKEYKLAKTVYPTLDHINSFSDVDILPKFPSCSESGSNDDALDCFNNQMVEHVQKHFKYPKRASEDYIEGQVKTQFVIDEEGNVTNIQLFGPDNGKILERAAEKLIEKLPKFIPAKKGDKAVGVKYSLPIDFKLG